MNSNVSIELVGVSLLIWVNIHGDNYYNQIISDSNKILFIIFKKKQPLCVVTGVRKT